MKEPLVPLHVPAPAYLTNHSTQQRDEVQRDEMIIGYQPTAPYSARLSPIFCSGVGGRSHGMGRTTSVPKSRVRGPNGNSTACARYIQPHPPRRLLTSVRLQRWKVFRTLVLVLVPSIEIEHAAIHLRHEILDPAASFLNLDPKFLLCSACTFKNGVQEEYILSRGCRFELVSCWRRF